MIPPIQRQGRVTLAGALALPVTPVEGSEAADAPASTALDQLRSQLATLEDLLDVSRLLVFNAVVPPAHVPSGDSHALDDALTSPLRINYDAYCNVRQTIEAAGGNHKRLADLMTAATYLKVS